MNMEKNLRSHGIRRIFYDILRDTNNAKYSMTKFAALIGLIALFATITMSIIIMWQNQETDHVLIVELIGFVLTLLGFKNSFGYKGSNGQSVTTNGNTDNTSTINSNINNDENCETDPDKGKRLLLEKKYSDTVDDSLKG